MLTDLSGCETSLTSAAASAHWNDTIRGFLAHSAATPEALAATRAAAPEFGQADAARGLFSLLLGRAELTEVAWDALARAEAHPGNRRERIYTDALRHWLSGRPSAAAEALETLLETWPEDALAMKLVQAIRFVLGQPCAMRASVEAVGHAYIGHAAEGYLEGCRAFTLEETGDYSAAEAAGRRALDLAPDDAWGLHAVAHVYDMTARAADGLGWLSTRDAAWVHCNNFRYHVWWHIALMHLDLGDAEAALDLYDAEIRADRTDDYRDISNAASLLARLEMDGVAVGARWEELAAIAERRSGDGCLVFADLHYMLSLMGGGRETAMRRMMARMAATAAHGECEMAAITNRPGLTAARGLEAYAEGRFASAFANLRAARGQLQTIGGSHAQRDVFDRLTIEAALRGGYLAAAEDILADRLLRRGGAEDGYTARRRSLIADARRDIRQDAAVL
ncbi:MAG: tetratricopeptide repeat protein [Pseudomonadota bacterium]